MKNSARALAWDDFRLIDAVAATRNLPAAALRLGIDHSTVFRRLKTIEAALGQTLFERHRAGYALTPAGEEVAALAARVDEDITAVTRRLAGQAVAPAGEVRIATSDTLLSDLLQPMLRAFRQQHPLIALDLVTGNAALNLSRRDADVAVRATDNPPDTLVGRRAARIAWALYGAAEHGHGAVTPASLAGADWVCLGENLAGLKVVRAVLDTVPPARLAARFDAVGGVAGAIEAGLGIGFLPCLVGDNRATLRRLGAPVPAYASDLWLLTHPDLREVPRIRALLDFLAAAVAARRGVIEGEAPRAAARGDAVSGNVVAGDTASGPVVAGPTTPGNPDPEATGAGVAGAGVAGAGVAGTGVAGTGVGMGERSGTAAPGAPGPRGGTRRMVRASS